MCLNFIQEELAKQWEVFCFFVLVKERCLETSAYIFCIFPMVVYVSSFFSAQKFKFYRIFFGGRGSNRLNRVV